MYQVYIDKPSYFEAEMAAEFKDLESAEAFALKETNGCVNSYGEQIAILVKRG